MLTDGWHWMAQRVRRAALPLGCYYTVTLLIPLVNGARWADAGFVEHAVVVACVPLALIVLVAVLWAGVQLAAGAVPLRRTVLPRMSGAPGRRGARDVIDVLPQAHDRLRS